MPLPKLRTSGVQGVGLIAVTYVYFLIFAQFAFIHRLDTLGIAGDHLKFVMAAMAIGGILLSLLAPRVSFLPSPARRLQLAFCLAGIAAFLTISQLTVGAAIAVSMLIGAALGLLTVTLVTHLRQWTGNHNPLLKVGLGTGIGYFLCNVPSLFIATPQVQSATAGLLCLAGIILANFTVEASTESDIELSINSRPLLRAQYSIRPRRRILRRTHMARLRRLLHHPEHCRPQSGHMARLGTPLVQRFHSPRRSHVQRIPAAPPRPLRGSGLRCRRSRSRLPSTA